MIYIKSRFLSTLSLRRATSSSDGSSGQQEISIHALLAESDASTQQEKNNGHEFLSTLSLRRATSSPNTDIIILDISIHALLAESDLIFTARHPAIRVFLSTLSLRRATKAATMSALTILYFYPRSPCGERHWAKALFRYLGIISIHALLAESDGTLTWRTGLHLYFYPRSPCGERLGGAREEFKEKIFLSTLSLRRATDNRHRF